MPKAYPLKTRLLYIVFTLREAYLRTVPRSQTSRPGSMQDIHTHKLSIAKPSHQEFPIPIHPSTMAMNGLISELVDHHSMTEDDI